MKIWSGVLDHLTEHIIVQPCGGLRERGPSTGVLDKQFSGVHDVADHGTCISDNRESSRRNWFGTNKEIVYFYAQLFIIKFFKYTKKIHNGTVSTSV